MMSWEHPYDVIRGENSSLTVRGFGTDSNTCLFIWFSSYSETFFLFPYMHLFSYWLDKYILTISGP